MPKQKRDEVFFIPARRCERCGHMERFEADGPFEAGWNVCPVCVTPVRAEEEAADGTES